jgi:hypothetical protein
MNGKKKKGLIQKSQFVFFQPVKQGKPAGSSENTGILATNGPYRFIRYPIHHLRGNRQATVNLNEGKIAINKRAFGVHLSNRAPHPFHCYNSSGAN